MKPILVLLISSLLFFFENRVNAACGSINLKANGVSYECKTVLKDTFSFINFKAIVETNKTYLLEIYNNGNNIIKVDFFNSNPCNSSQVVNSEWISLYYQVELTEAKPYFQVSSLKNEGVPFSVRLIEKETQTNCNENVNIHNSLKNPLECGNIIVGQNCINSCNLNCQYYHYEDNILRQNIHNRVKWLKFSKTDNIQEVKISISSSALENPEIIMYGFNNNYKYFYAIKNKLDTNGLIDITRFDEIEIGVYDRGGKDGNFTLCIEGFQHKESCVDFFEKSGDTLYIDPEYKAINTPIFEGDTVKFVYKITDWVPIGQNWLHGLSITKGDGWFKLFLDTIVNTPKQNIIINQISLDSAQLSSRVTFTEVDTFSLSQINFNDLIVPGWYFNFANIGPTGLDVKHNWGVKFEKIHGTFENPLLELKFALIASKVQNGGCAGPITSFVEIKPHSDFITGNYKFQGCTNNESSRIPIQIECCIPPQISQLRDTVICNESEFNMKNYLKVSSKYRIIKNETDISFLKENYDYSDNIIGKNNSTTTEKSMQLRVYWQKHSSQCPDSSDFEIKVRPKLPIVNLSVENLCQGTKVEVDQVIENILKTEKPDLGLFVTKNEKVVAELRNKESTFQKTFVNKYNCKVDGEITLNTIKCSNSTTNNEDFNFTISPNPAIKETTIKVENNTESNDFELKIVDGQGKLYTIQKIYLQNGVSVFKPDIKMLSSGFYYVYIGNEKVLVQRSLIIIYD